MQNTIIKEFENDPRVATAVFEEGGRFQENTSWMRTFWSNYYLRGSVLWDADGSVGGRYKQPSTGLPFGRGFIIDRAGNVALPYFGHRPRLVIETIHRLLGDFAPGDANGDGEIDVSDAITILLHLFGGRGVDRPEVLDVNGDGTTGIADAIYLIDFLFTGGPPPAEG